LIFIRLSGTRYRGRKLISFSSYILILLLAAFIFSDQMGSITVALGVASAGIAFALQEVITSVAGWFAISFAHFYKIGDRVQLSGTRGRRIRSQQGEEVECKGKEVVMGVIFLFSDEDKFWAGRESEWAEIVSSGWFPGVRLQPDHPKWFKMLVIEGDMPSSSLCKPYYGK
jgi:hypothetical protein